MTPDDHEAPDLVVLLRESLDEPDPLDLLSVASRLISTLDPTPSPFSPRSKHNRDGWSDDFARLLHTLITMPSEETDSLLVAFAEILDDPVLRAIVQNEVKPRLQVMPPWLAELARLRVTRAVLLQHIMGGEESIALEATGPRGGFMMVVDIERLGNPFVEDAYLTPETIDGLVERLTRVTPEDLVIKPLELRDARARIEDGIEITDLLVPPVRTDTWPACRPLLEWALRGMPEGGEGYVYTEWEQEDIEAFLNEFMGSRPAFGYTRGDRDLARSLVRLALNYGTWNPRQWGPRFVERLLLDLIPRKIMFSTEDMEAFPRILGALVQFGNTSRGLPDSATQQVLDLIEELTPDYLRLVTPDAQDDESAWFGSSPYADPYVRPDLMTLLADAAGGEEALENLDAEPLPIGEPLQVEGVPEDVLERVKGVGELVAKHGSEYFSDPEMPTAANRTLHLIATQKPEVFRRRAKDLNTAAAILFNAGHNNRWFTRNDPERTVAALARTMGVKTVDRDRAYNAIRGLQTTHTAASAPSSLSLGRPELLTSTRRQDILDLKKRLDENAEDVDP